jgi:hypothetical protein
MGAGRAVLDWTGQSPVTTQTNLGFTYMGAVLEVVLENLRG